MATSARALMQRAHSLVYKPFSVTYGRLHGGRGLDAYCAAYVRWCFTGVGVSLPVASEVEFYRHNGLRYVGAENTADGFSGRDIGDVVTRDVRAGDILLFRNTCRGWPTGTITHVGIASESRGYMYDAGGGSLVHHRSIEGTFPGLLVEVRRPRVFGGAAEATPPYDAVPARVNDQSTRLVLKNGHVSAKLRGKPVRQLNVLVQRSGLCAVEGHVSRDAIISIDITDAHGTHHKLFKHHGKVFATEGFASLWFECNNGMLAVSKAVSDEKHLNPRTGRREPEFTNLKPTSVELMIVH